MSAETGNEVFSHPARRRVDIVIPVFNEEEAIDVFYLRLARALETLPYAFTLYFVNDGSRDRTQECLQAIASRDRRVVVVELSRNFGHQAAQTAGLDLAQGDYVISMDGDGEHPPEMLAEMLALAEQGYDVVLAQRAEEQQASAFKRRTSEWFYQLINRIGDTHVLPGAGDFRLLARPVVTALRGMREYHRFLRGMVPWVGFRTCVLPYAPSRRMAGQSKYSLRKMLRLAMDAIFSFSLVPLYASISMGALLLLLALAEVVYVLSFWIGGRSASLAPGWSSLMFVLLFIGGTLMIAVGFIGVYIGYIFQQVKGRPIYLVRSIYPGQSPAGAPDPGAARLHTPYE